MRNFLRIVIPLFFISFLFASPLHEAKIRALLQKKFQEAYPSMQINAIHLQPSSNLIHKLDGYRVTNVAVTKDTLRRAKGSVMVTLQKGQKKRRLYFKYNLDATVTLYKSAQPIQRGARLIPQMATKVTIPFNALYHRPITDEAFYRYVAKQHIGVNKPLTIEKFKNAPDIQRNDTVTAVIKEGGIELQFTAKALQDGNVGDIIRIRKDYKRHFKARVLSNTDVEVVE